MQRKLSLFAGLLLTATTCHALVITPVWEYLVKGSPTDFAQSQTAAYLPFLTNIWNNSTVTNNQQITSDTYPLLGKLTRYDQNRMLLGIMENGIQESADLQTTNFPFYQLSTNFPDRSLIWINPTNGAPLGIALKIGRWPLLPSRPAWVSNYVKANTFNVNMGYSPNWGDSSWKYTSIPAPQTLPGFMIFTNSLYWDDCWYMDYDVSDDGYIYVGHRYSILRYAPNGSGGFVTTPEVIFTVGVSTNSWGQTNGTSNIGNDRGKHRWFDLCGNFTSIKVRGSGLNTRITAGGRGSYEFAAYGDREIWYIGPWVDANNRTNWFPIAHSSKTSSPGTSGGPHTAMISALDNSALGPNEIWCYDTEFPANNGNSTSPFCLAFTNANPNAYTNGLVGADAYTAPLIVTNFGKASYGTGNGYLGVNTTFTPYYRQQYVGGLECRAGVPFLVTCETPGWTASGSGNGLWNGYLGLHDLVTGQRLGAYDQGTQAADIKLGVDPSMNFYGRIGEVTISAQNGPDQAGGTWEVTYGSYCFGYGRYIVQPDNISITNIVYNATAGASTNLFTGNSSTNNAYVLQRASDLLLGDWQDIQYNTNWPGPYDGPGTNMVDLTAPADKAFYRVKVITP